jgi:hypothetical protein
MLRTRDAGNGHFSHPDEAVVIPCNHIGIRESNQVQGKVVRIFSCTWVSNLARPSRRDNKPPIFVGTGHGEHA